MFQSLTSSLCNHIRLRSSPVYRQSSLCYWPVEWRFVLLKALHIATGRSAVWGSEVMTATRNATVSATVSNLGEAWFALLSLPTSFSLSLFFTLSVSIYQPLSHPLYLSLSLSPLLSHSPFITLFSRSLSLSLCLSILLSHLSLLLCSYQLSTNELIKT